MSYFRRARPLAAAVLAAGVAVAVPATSAAAPTGPDTVGGFSYGQLQAQAVGAPGCGTNAAGEPSIHVSKENRVGLSSENGLGRGSQYWRGVQVGGSTAAGGCDLTYAGQPNAVGGVGLSGGDTDSAFAPERSANGTYRAYVASLNLGSVNVATSEDNGKTFSQTPVQAGLPLDDREWIAAYGADTSLLSYHDIATKNIDMLRSDNGGKLYHQVSRVIPDGDYKAMNNQLGNLVIDHRNPSPVDGGFWAYQSYVAPSKAGGKTYDEAFLGVSKDGGSTWANKPIPCSTKFGGKKDGLNHQFPNVSVAPNGTLYYTVSNDKSIYVARSDDHGDSWTCSGAISTAKKSVFPWVVATDKGEDLVYYGTDDGTHWYVYFAQNLDDSVSGWSNTRLMPVHNGPVCEGGAGCTNNRQLLDDFGVDTDQNGYAHIAYSHDAPDLGGQDTYTGYAVQQAGSPVGAPN